MRTGLLLVAGLALLGLAAPSALADNPGVSAPTTEAGNVQAGALAAVGAVNESANTFAAAAQDNATVAAGEVAAGRAPTDQANNTVIAGGAFASGVAGAAGTLVGNASANAQSAVETKRQEAVALGAAVQGVANTAIGVAGGVAAVVVDTVCHAPVNPGSAVPCDTGSIVDNVNATANAAVAAALGIAGSANPNSTLCAVKAALNGLVVGAGDPVPCTP